MTPILYLLLVLAQPPVSASPSHAVLEEIHEDYADAQGHFTMMMVRKFLVLPDGTRVRVKGETPIHGGAVTFHKEHIHGKPRKEPALTEATIDASGLTQLTAGDLPAETIAPALFLLVQWTGQPQWTTTASALTAAMDADNNFRTASYGKFGLAVTVSAWATIDPPSFCDYLGIQDTALAALSAQGIHYTFSYIHTMFPPLGACPWAGLGYLGGLAGYPAKQSWGNGATWTPRHEMGHSQGFNHSHFYARNDGVTRMDEYGDDYDDMGACCGNGRMYNAGQKVSIGWLTPTPVYTSGTYTLQPIDKSDSTGVIALDFPPIVGMGGILDHYFVETRANFGGAVLIHWGTALWDLDPGPAEVHTLAVGATATLPKGQRITNLRSDVTGATIQVAFTSHKPSKLSNFVVTQ